MQAENQAVLKDKLDFLHSLPVIGEQSDEVLTSIAYVCTPREYPPNEVIIAQGDEVEDMYFILNGNIKLIKCAFQCVLVLVNAMIRYLRHIHYVLTGI